MIPVLSFLFGLALGFIIKSPFVIRYYKEIKKTEKQIREYIDSL